MPQRFLKFMVGDLKTYSINLTENMVCLYFKTIENCVASLELLTQLNISLFFALMNAP